MVRDNTVLLEREINIRIAKILRKSPYLVLQEVRCPACEIDIVLFDPVTLQLAGFEIKRHSWRETLIQACRNQLYCHFSIAVLPFSMQKKVPEEEFSRHGIGIIYYSVTNRSVDLQLGQSPKITNKINRNLKRKLYERFSVKFGDELNARS
jgi:hypothetical protein